MAPSLHVGIPERFDGPYAPVPPRVLAWVARAGFEPVVLLRDDPKPPAFDALLLAGGITPGPPIRGLVAGSATGSVVGEDHERDEREYRALELAIERNRPILGVCRGMQVLTLAFGGSLVSLSNRPRSATDSPHAGSDSPGGDRRPAAHHVRLAFDSRLAGVTGTTSLDACSSQHTFGVDISGAPAVNATGWAPDGTIEAIELTNISAVGVLWHPEDAADADRAQVALLRVLHSSI